jgi:hypothetical protein
VLPLYLIHGSEFIKGISAGLAIPFTWTSAYYLSPHYEYIKKFVSGLTDGSSKEVHERYKNKISIELLLNCTSTLVVINQKEGETGDNSTSY